MKTFLAPDPEHLVVLALSGVLPEDQAEEILESVRFRGHTMETAFLNQISNQLRARTPLERLARCNRGQ